MDYADDMVVTGLNASQLRDLIKQAVRDGILEAEKIKAAQDFERQQKLAKEKHLMLGNE